MKTFLRSLGAVLAGMFTWALLWLSTNAALSAAFPRAYADDGSTTSAGLLLTMLAASVLFSIAAGWVTAKVASGGKILAHTLALGVAQLAIGVMVQLQYWDVMPLWYHLPFLALLLPGNVVGGLLQSR
ncbi:MAG: hypothetical protein AAGF23_20445 [Acidobacteriota bacterium]